MNAHTQNYPRPADDSPTGSTLRIAAMCTAFVGALALAPLSGCNTVEGAGEDIEAAGESIEDAADGS